MDGRTDGRSQNYIPPTSSGDKKSSCIILGCEEKNASGRLELLTSIDVNKDLHSTCISFINKNLITESNLDVNLLCMLSNFAMLSSCLLILL